MPTILLTLLSSKKFLVALGGLLVAFAARLGLPPDIAQEAAGAILLMATAYVGAQGAADFGKEAAGKASESARDVAAGVVKAGEIAAMLATSKMGKVE